MNSGDILFNGFVWCFVVMLAICSTCFSVFCVVSLWRWMA